MLLVSSHALMIFETNNDERLTFLIPFIIITVIVVLIGAPLKKITIDGSELVISNYYKKIRVPLSQIHCVSENFLISPKLIWITLKTPTTFGSKIKFIPVISLRDSFCAFHSHSIVKELIELSENNISHSES